MSEVIHANEASFDTIISTPDKVVLIDFWAPWCGPCRMLGPMLDKLAADNPNVLIAKVNVDENEALAGRFGVTGIPAMHLFKNGEEVDAIIGLVSYDTLVSKVSAQV